MSYEPTRTPRTSQAFTSSEGLKPLFAWTLSTAHDVQYQKPPSASCGTKYCVLFIVPHLARRVCYYSCSSSLYLKRSANTNISVIVPATLCEIQKILGIGRHLSLCRMPAFSLARERVRRDSSEWSRMLPQSYRGDTKARIRDGHLDWHIKRMRPFSLGSYSHQSDIEGTSPG